MSATAGFTLCALTLGLLLGVVWYLIHPFIFWVTPEGPFDVDVGIVAIDTVRETFDLWALAFVCLLLWWRLAPVLVRARARLDCSLLAQTRASLERRVAEVSESRAQTIDHSAVELRRIERDLHDGAQARLVALGMSLGMAEQMLVGDPEGAAELLGEARRTTASAFGDLRSVVRGIHPPVLSYDAGRLRMRVEDDGRGGADVSKGTGLLPVAVPCSTPRLSRG